MLLRHKTAALLTGAILLTSLSSCKNPSPVPDPGPQNVTTTTTEGTAATEPSAPEKDRNPLTGEAGYTGPENGRPVAIMIPNDKTARPQVGLEQADLYVEAETEGGITRIMAVFPDVSRVPDRLAPIRSARTPFLMLAQSLDALYVHWGDSVAARDRFNTTGMDHIDAMRVNDGTFWRDAELKRTRDTEHSSMTGGPKLAAHIAKKGLRSTTAVPSPFSFGEREGTGAGQRVQVNVSPSRPVVFEYDAEQGVYRKYNGTLDNRESHSTTAGIQLAAANVLLMKAEKYQENDVTIGFRLTAGDAVMCSRGASRPVRWTRTDNQLSFTEADGSPLLSAEGKTYICLISLDSRIILE
ncbi:MAG: DUF3048 domain-containing protein [Clostridiales bacterium]|nr:DUF3048 domain-containing protein [Clostridiales bacterium]